MFFFFFKLQGFIILACRKTEGKKKRRKKDCRNTLRALSSLFFPTQSSYSFPALSLCMFVCSESLSSPCPEASFHDSSEEAALDLLASEACVSSTATTTLWTAFVSPWRWTKLLLSGCVLVNAWFWTVLRGREVFVLSWPQQEYILGRRHVRVKLWIVLKKSLHLLTLHHLSRAEKGLSSSDCVRSLVTNLWVPCAPRGHFLHSHPGGLCHLISEQAVVSNLPFLPISRELKVQIVDLIPLISSRTLLGLCCSRTAES